MSLQVKAVLANSEQPSVVMIAGYALNEDETKNLIDRLKLALKVISKDNFIKSPEALEAPYEVR